MRKFFRRLSALFHRRRLQQELEAEMAAHREMMPSDRRHKFGSTLHFQEEVADQWGWTLLDQIRQDVVYGARSLRGSPGFTLTAIAVLSLGIGVNLAAINVLQALRHRLNVRDLGSLCKFSRVTKEGETSTFSVPAIEFYRHNNTVLSAVMAVVEIPSVLYGEDSEALRCSAVSGNLFAQLGITPAHGRLLDETDDHSASPPVVVLAYHLLAKPLRRRSWNSSENHPIERQTCSSGGRCAARIHGSR